MSTATLESREQLKIKIDGVLRPLPAPSADMTAYRRNFWLGMLLSPRRLYNYWMWKRSSRSADVRYMPIKMDFENVSRCNFRCVMCQVSDWEKGTRAEDMPFEKFKEMIDEQYGLFEIKIQGMGEPTLQKDEYIKMIRYARSKRIWVRTTTNTSLLHRWDMYKKLVDSGVNEIQISVDGASQETMESIRRGSKFQLVVDNCKLINAYCREKNVLRTRMWVVVQRLNIHELDKFADFAHELGFRRLSLALNLNDWGQDAWQEANTSATVENEITADALQRVYDRGRELGIEVSFWHNTSKYSSSKKEKLCPWPFDRAYVASDMRIVACCLIGNPDVHEIGKASDFKKLWFGDAYREFRTAHLEGRVPRICEGCYEAPKAAASVDSDGR